MNGKGNRRTANAKNKKKERKKKMRAQMKYKTISQCQETKQYVRFFFKFLHIQVVIGVYIWDYCNDLTVDNQFF